MLDKTFNTDFKYTFGLKNTFETWKTTELCNQTRHTCNNDCFLSSISNARIMTKRVEVFIVHFVELEQLRLGHYNYNCTL